MWLGAYKETSNQHERTIDSLVLGEGERDPTKDLRLQFDAASRMPEEEHKIVKALIEGMIVKYQSAQDIIRKLATTLVVSADERIFGEGTRGPDKKLRLQFEAICQLSEQERQVVTELLDGMIIKYQARRWDTSREQTAK